MQFADLMKEEKSKCLLYDKDLLSVQEVRELVENAKTAQKELAEKSQEQVDAIVRSIADAGVRNAKRLASISS